MRVRVTTVAVQLINLLATDFFFQILAHLYLNVSNTETKQGSIMK